ncbi:hypothetical protein RRG08_012241 [Elysia crispata]|uniref:Uncharacterized protein n=1 Tax=Elysia crispata TaxID=231223 RepID=A0AAE0YP19_9GAST|nr:hypothetical protein RRG08_012241 [Elysia crispata]
MSVIAREVERSEQEPERETAADVPRPAGSDSTRLVSPAWLSLYPSHLLETSASPRHVKSVLSRSCLSPSCPGRAVIISKSWCYRRQAKLAKRHTQPIDVHRTSLCLAEN